MICGLMLSLETANELKLVMCIDIKVLYLLFLKKMIHVLDFLYERKNDYVISDDVNINLLKSDWHTLDYLNCISSVGVRQFVNSQTRYSADFSNNSLFDYVYFNIDCKNLNVCVVNYDMLIICMLCVKLFAKRLKLKLITRCMFKISAHLMLGFF